MATACYGDTRYAMSAEHPLPLCMPLQLLLHSDASNQFTAGTHTLGPAAEEPQFESEA